MRHGCFQHMYYRLYRAFNVVQMNERKNQKNGEVNRRTEVVENPKRSIKTVTIIAAITVLLIINIRPIIGLTIRPIIGLIIWPIIGLIIWPHRRHTEARLSNWSGSSPLKRHIFASIGRRTLNKSLKHQKAITATNTAT